MAFSSILTHPNVPSVLASLLASLAGWETKRCLCRQRTVSVFSSLFDGKESIARVVKRYGSIHFLAFKVRNR